MPNRVELTLNDEVSIGGVAVRGPLFMSRAVYRALARHIYDEQPPHDCHLEIRESADGGYKFTCEGPCNGGTCGKYLIDSPDEQGRYIMRVVCECH